MRSIGLIYAHQLFFEHPVLKDVDELDAIYLVDDVWLYEGKGEWQIRPHKKRILHLKASVLAYVDFLTSEGIEVRRVGSIAEVPQATRVKVCRVLDDFIQRELEERMVTEALDWIESPGFVTPTSWADRFFKDGKKPFMKTFYEAQRKRMSVLLDEQGNPTGGKWSFDEENRKKLPKKVEIPVSPLAKYSEKESSWIEKARTELIDSGQWEAAQGEGKDIRFPVTHTGASDWLERFLKERFLGFGTYEDALSTRGDFLFHSVLTPMLNIGLLTPQQVVDETLEFAENHSVPMNDLEGFIRQIIGWREFIAIIYQRNGGWMRNQNFWGFEEEIPESVWKGQTGIEPIDYVIDKVNREGYAHHIERLMVMGNFFMLMRIHPTAVYKWFMEMFVDAYDWVMVPNVYGMSQYASGGFMVTKPYLSGSNYLKKMSDFPAGEWCRVWDALYWSFIDDHRDFFASQFRMKMMLGHLDRMGTEKLAEHQKLAAEFRQTMREGKRWGEATLF